ncbi:NAD(P)-binding protein [Auricularia subglabra TFB-10046 SS5]|nr:NAD(P)-binding protein [Auricularia subglabra TFB-10046 SS5]
MHTYALAAAATALFSVALYLRHVERALGRVHPEALKASPKRYTDEDVLEVAQQLERAPVDVKPFLGPRTGRRYIVVGGSGFVGGWIVLHLLARGEDPHRIRILDIRAPSRKEFVDGVARDVEFVQTDITDPASVDAAFQDAWPEGDAALQHELTVFQGASILRYIERAESLLPPVIKINVDGTANVLAAARKAGATAFVYTSSGSIGVKRTNLWIAPWESMPKAYFQRLDDRDLDMPVKHTEYFSNYAVTKIQAEKLVREANGKGGMYTASVRPSNGVYGIGGDSLADAYLVRGTNPTWIKHVVQNAIYVENCSIAHLNAEEALLSHPAQVGGNAYYITDPNPAITYGDMYRVLSLLSGGRVKFPVVPVAPLMLVAHVIEFLHVARARFPWLPIPRIRGEAVMLQPPIFSLTSIHLVFDDSRARKPPSAGGIGYRTPFTTLQGLAWTTLTHEDARRRGEKRADQVNFGLGGAHLVPKPARADTVHQFPVAAEVKHVHD